MHIADPARAVAEMLHTPALGGGIRHVAEILDTYLESDEPTALLDALERLDNGAAFKRLGYLVERLNIDQPRVIDPCERRVTAGFSDLDPAMPSDGMRSVRWGLRINVELES